MIQPSHASVSRLAAVSQWLELNEVVGTVYGSFYAVSAQG